MMFDKVITEPLTIAWIDDNYNRYQHFMEPTFKSCTLNKSVESQIICKKYINPKDNDHREYYLVMRHDWGQTHKIVPTWENASAMCRLMGGHLPWFGSRDSLSEILAFLKLSQYIPTAEAIYIGLKFQENEVSEDCFVSVMYENNVSGK